jgi:Raf kinase inhibitor-like YbhB/YbcL family protein
MHLARFAPRTLKRSLRGGRAGAAPLASRELSCARLPTIEVRSRAFFDDGPLPTWVTKDGPSTPPPLEWSPLPPEAESTVVLCEDPDARAPHAFVHWLVYGIPAAVPRIDGDSGLWEEGRNGLGTTGFAGTAPSSRHGVHRYHFQVFALDSVPDLDAGVERAAILEAMRGHVIAFGELVGRCPRNK